MACRERVDLKKGVKKSLEKRIVVCSDGPFYGGFYRVSISDMYISYTSVSKPTSLRASLVSNFVEQWQVYLHRVVCRRKNITRI